MRYTWILFILGLGLFTPLCPWTRGQEKTPSPTSTGSSEDKDQSPTSKSAPPREVVEVEGKGTSKGPRDDSTSFTTRLKPSQERYKFQTLPEILSQSQGVQIRNFGGLGKLSTISIRGSSSQQVTVFLDGFRLNTAQNGSVDFSNLPLGAIDRVEIIRGGDSTRYGSSAIGGIVQLFTIPPREKAHTLAAFSYGSYQTAELNLSRAHQVKGWGDYVVALQLFQIQGDFEYTPESVRVAGVTLGGGEEQKRENNRSAYLNLLTKMGRDLTSKVRVELLHEFFSSEKEIPGSERFPLNQAHQRDLRSLLGLKWTAQQVGGKDLDVTAKIYHRWDELSFTNPAPILGSSTRSNHINQAWGGEIITRYYHTHWALEHEWTFFAAVRRDLLDSTDLRAPDRTTYRLFVQDEFYWGREQLILSPAVGFMNSTDGDEQFTGKLGVSYQHRLPEKWIIAVQANGRRVFRYPEFNELYYPNLGYLRGNPDLKPEKGWVFDGGIVVKGPTFRGEVVVFYHQLEDSIVYVNISPNLVSPVNTDRVRSSGVEISTEVSPWELIQFQIAYTYLQARLKPSDNQLPGRGEHEVKGKITFRWDPVEVFASGRYRSEVPTNLANTIILKETFQLDLGLAIKFWDHGQIAFQVKNALDADLRDVRGYPLPGRSFFAKITLQF